MQQKKTELEKIKNTCENCKKCELYKTRTNLVFSGGIENNKLMLISEAPGYYEDQSGKTFVGKAGNLLDKILISQDFSKDKNVYFCNILKCHPPKNRNPLPEEITACKGYLDAQIEILKPKIILLCGGIAAKAFIDTPYGITKIRGKWYDGPNEAKMMPIFHPSYLLRNDSHKKDSPKWLMWQDIQEIKKVYDSL